VTGTADEFTSSLVDAAPDGMIVVDGAGAITFANRQAVELFGIPWDELVGASVDSLLPDHMRAAHAAHRADYHDDPSIRPMGGDLLLHARRGDGSVFPVEISLSPIRGPGPFLVVAAIRDVTARVAAEQEMQRVVDALRDAEQVMAVADDRERIARDLHDTVIQRLFASGLALQAVAARVDPVVNERLATIVADLDQTIREIRTAIFALQASAGTSTGVRTRILDIVREATLNLGFEPRLHFQGAIETMPGDVAEHLLATLREALANTARHSHAGGVQVVVEVDGDHARLTVSDDGVGVADVAPRGHGLANMAARASGLGGALVIERRQPAGTTLTWTVPLGHAQHRDVTPSAPAASP
jgi:two-component system sensor histidine kinase DevS